MTIVTATATRQGTSSNNADGAAIFAAVDSTVGAAVIDLAGHHANAPFVTRLCAETAARIAPQRGGLAALCTASFLVADPGAASQPEPDGVAVCAVARPDGETRIAWIGDAHAYAWQDGVLTRLTTPHTWAEQARVRFGIDVPAASDILATSLALASPATVLTIHTQAPLVLLASDGLDAVGHDDLADLIASLSDDAQDLADALVTAPGEDAEGYRDDVTVVVITNTTVSP